MVNYNVGENITISHISKKLKLKIFYFPNDICQYKGLCNDTPSIWLTCREQRGLFQKSSAGGAADAVTENC
jgi:hypothetical protein